MIIEFKADEIRNFVRENLGLHGFETIVKQEIDNIIKRHRSAAINEIQDFAFKIATRRESDGLGVTLTITTTDQKPLEP